MKIYVASSWQNRHQQGVVAMLRRWGHQVYDFREHGFGWEEIDENWERWTTHDYVTGLRHPIAEGAFQEDYRALRWANACVLVMPCGRSAHLEAGWSVGQGKPTCFFFPTEWPASTPVPVDLMHGLGDIALSERALKEWSEQFAFCPRCDFRFKSECDVATHVMREHLSGRPGER